MSKLNSETRGKVAAEPLAVDAVQLARLLAVSIRHVRRLDASGQLPRGVRLGRAKRWLVEEIREWLSAGSPDRATCKRTRSRSEEEKNGDEE